MAEDVTQDHEEKETLFVDVLLPGHELRVTTPTFEHTRKQAIKERGDRCTVCNRNSEEAGSGIEWHHLIERSTANVIDWIRLTKFALEFEAIFQRLADYMRTHPSPPANIIDFVDDMTANGVPLCKEHHTARGTGIHTMPFPLFSVWAFGKPGFQFVKGDQVIDADEAAMAAQSNPPPVGAVTEAQAEHISTGH